MIILTISNLLDNWGRVLLPLSGVRLIGNIKEKLLSSHLKLKK